MPLVVVTGFPSSGKSWTTRRIRDFFEREKGKVVKVISENEYVSGTQNEIYPDSRKEKLVRGNLKSDVARLLHKDEVLILDSLNYIKGFRYELYCVSKSTKTTQCTVQCDVSAEDAWTWNCQREDQENKYNKDVFDGLVMRYEPPVSHNRWDSPLLLSLKDLPLDLESVYSALFSRKAPPPNQSTQCQPLSSTTFLYELDRVTKDIVQAVLEAQRSGLACEGDAVTVPGTSERVQLAAGRQTVTMAELSRIKRQFITYAKSRAIEDVGKLASMFVQYLNSSLSGRKVEEDV